MLGVMTRKFRASSDSGSYSLWKKLQASARLSTLVLPLPVAIFTTNRRQVSSNMPPDTSAAGIEAHQVVLVLDPHHVVQIDDRLQGLALGEVVLKLAMLFLLGRGPSTSRMRRQQVRRVEPPIE